jgi:hypothetical protein
MNDRSTAACTRPTSSCFRRSITGKRWPRRDRLHHTDVGGGSPTNASDSTEVYAEACASRR